MAYAELAPEDPLTIHISTDWTEKNLITQVPGAGWKSQLGVWTLPRSWGSYLILSGVFKSQITFGPNLLEWVTEQKAAWIDNAMILRDNLELHPDDAWPAAAVLRSWREA